MREKSNEQGGCVRMCKFEKLFGEKQYDFEYPCSNYSSDLTT